MVEFEISHIKLYRGVMRWACLSYVEENVQIAEQFDSACYSNYCRQLWGVAKSYIIVMLFDDCER